MSAISGQLSLPPSPPQSALHSHSVSYCQSSKMPRTDINCYILAFNYIHLLLIAFISYFLFNLLLDLSSVVLSFLMYYKPVHREFDSRRGHCVFIWPNPCSRTLVRLNLWREWVSGIFLWAKDGRRLRLPTSPPSVSWLWKMLGPRRLTNQLASTACYKANFTCIIFLLTNFVLLCFPIPFYYFLYRSLCPIPLFLSLKLFLLFFLFCVLRSLNLFIPVTLFPCVILLPTSRNGIACDDKLRWELVVTRSVLCLERSWKATYSNYIRWKSY
jgi:hypothetical protein